MAIVQRCSFSGHQKLEHQVLNNAAELLAFIGPRRLQCTRHPSAAPFNQSLILHFPPSVHANDPAASTQSSSVRPRQAPVPGDGEALKSAVVDLNIGKGAVLVQLQGPCEADPFRFLALKWIEVRPPPVPVVGKMLVAPRDVMFLGGTGTMVRPDTGEYIGYEVHHSIEHPAFPPVEGLRRTRVVIGSIYRPRPDGTVDLFIKSYSMEADMGKIMGSLAMSHASRCIERVWTVPVFAYAKKLRWCMDNRLHGNNKHKGLTARLTGRCGAGAKNVRRIKTESRRVCRLCKVPLCSNCRVKEALVDVDQLFRARKIAVRICSICRDFVKGVSASEIARLEMNQQRPAVFDPLTPNTLDVLARDFSLDNSFCTASVESLCIMETPRSSERTELLN